MHVVVTAGPAGLMLLDKLVNRQPYYREGAPPDPRCLSYTHDRDFGHFLDYPPNKRQFKGGGWCPPAHACYDQMAPALWKAGYHEEL